MKELNEIEIELVVGGVTSGSVVESPDTDEHDGGCTPVGPTIDILPTLGN